MNKFAKSAGIGIGALILSTVAIQASDVYRNVNGGLAGMVISSSKPCGDNAVEMLLGSHALCVDTFEASPSSDCPYADPNSQVQTQENANVIACHPQSKQGVMPWTFVSLTQAQQLCARVGKRLPTNEEWYKAVSGTTNMSSCVLNTQNTHSSLTGSTHCATPSGIYDMVGNVWEWVDGEIDNGIYNNRAIPSSGYVSLVDSNGVVLKTAATSSSAFGDDYAETSTDGVRGMIRGGFYGSKSDGGIFAQNLSVPLDFRSIGVGFRCVRDL